MLRLTPKPICDTLEDDVPEDEALPVGDELTEGVVLVVVMVPVVLVLVVLGIVFDAVVGLVEVKLEEDSADETGASEILK